MANQHGYARRSLPWASIGVYSVDGDPTAELKTQWRVMFLMTLAYRTSIIHAKDGSARRVAPVVQLVLPQLPAQCVAMDPQYMCGARLGAVNAVQYPLYESFLKFPDGLVEQNPALHHPAHKPFHLILHVATLQRTKAKSPSSPLLAAPASWPAARHF